jgi:opine dehydrogenase
MYAEATTLAARLIEQFDEDRLRVAEALDCDLESSPEWFEKAYLYTGHDISDAVRKSPHAQRFSPVEGLAQLLMEDLAYFYVPVSRLGKALGIQTPIIDAITNIWGTMLDIDYWGKGVTLEQLGLAGLTAEQIIEYVNTGQK